LLIVIFAMNVHLIKKQTIEDYVLGHARSRPSFEEWLQKLKAADWTQSADMQYTFGNVDLLGKGSNRVVFDIWGNNYRLICKYAFGDNEVHLFICWVGTHAEYDKLNLKGEQYTIVNY
jgi:mRNA interferase HigB